MKKLKENLQQAIAREYVKLKIERVELFAKHPNREHFCAFTFRFVLIYLATDKKSVDRI